MQKKADYKDLQLPELQVILEIARHLLLRVVLPAAALVLPPWITVQSPCLVSQSLRRMRSQWRHSHSMCSILPMNQLLFIRKIDLRGNLITNITSQLGKCMSRSWSSFGLMIRIKNWRIRGGRRRPSRQWRTGEIQEEGWRVKLRGRRNILMRRRILKRQGDGRGKIGNQKIIILKLKLLMNFCNSHLLMKMEITK